MSVSIVPSRAPQAFPESRVWLMQKGELQLEARVRFLSVGDYRPELRIYLLEPGKDETLLQSMVLPLDDDFRELAQQEQRAFDVQGGAK